MSENLMIINNIETNVSNNSENTNFVIDILDFLYEKYLCNSIFTSSAQELAEKALIKSNYNMENACKILVKSQSIKCAFTGFMAGSGGVITLPFAVPIEVCSVWETQLKMIMGIAYIYGFDLYSSEVRTLVYICLLGQTVSNIAKKTGIKIGTKMTKNAIQKINQLVARCLLAKIGQVGIVSIDKAVPFVGGIVGGTFDFTSTKIIVEGAIKMFSNDLA